MPLHSVRFQVFSEDNTLYWKIHQILRGNINSAEHMHVLEIDIPGRLENVTQEILWCWREKFIENGT